MKTQASHYVMDRATFGVHAEQGQVTGIQTNWKEAMEFSTRGKQTQDVMNKVGNQIRHETGWNDPVDSLSIHTYIAKNLREEASVEEKQKRNEPVDTPSKRQLRSFERQEGNIPSSSSPNLASSSFSDTPMENGPQIKL